MRVRTLKRGSVLIAIALMVSLLAMLAPANAAPGFAVAGPGGASAGYLTRQPVLQQGNNLKFLNLDVPLHDVRSGFPGFPDGKFQSPLIGPGKQAIVAGTNALPKGVYPFYCTLHGNMTGRLRVI